MTLLTFIEDAAEPRLTRSGAPDTSHEAARRNASSAAQRQAVLDFIRDCNDGATADEVCVVLGLSPNSVTPRLHELCGKNRKLLATGYRAQVVMTTQRRRTRTGRWAHVYEAI